MKVSVVIPSYRPGPYLWECLDSMAAQTLPKDDFEVILVLNGCCEPYKSEIEAYMAGHMVGVNVNFIQTDTPGVSNARNVALDVVRGEYVAFVDDDDYVSARYLEELYAKASPDTISLCYPYAFNDGKPDEQLPYGITDAYEYCKGKRCLSISSMVRKYFSGPCMKLIPMSFIHGRRFDVRFANGEDSLFMFLISDRFKNFAVTSREAVYYRRIREGSATIAKRSKTAQISNSQRCMKEYTRIYRKGGYSTLFYFTRIAAELQCQINSLIGK